MIQKLIHTLDIKTIIKNNIRNYSMFIMLALIMIIFAPLTNGSNWTARNFTNIFFQNSYVLILAVGMVQVIIIQGIDLSVGSVCAFVGAISVMIYNACLGIPALQPIALLVSFLASIIIGALIGAFQGSLVAYAKMPAFIVTLAGMLLFRGLTYIVTNVNPINPREVNYALLSTGTLDEVLGIGSFGPYYPLAFISGFEKFQIGPYFPMALILALVILAAFFITELSGRKKKITNEFVVISNSLFISKLAVISLLTLGLAERFAGYRGLPIVVLILGVTVFVFHFILRNTVLGRYIYAVGGNPRSAKLSGINSEMITFVVFCIMGGITGIAAVVSTGYMNSALPQAGNLFELDTIAACYIGGVSAGGGIGSVIGVIVGGLVMAAINNGMILMNLGNHYQYVVKALILLLAVFYDIYTRRKAGLG